MIIKYLYRLASGCQIINFSEKLFFAGISAYKNATFKANFYLLWSLPLNAFLKCIKKWSHISIGFLCIYSLRKSCISHQKVILQMELLRYATMSHL